MSERWKFFARGLRRVDGEAARRESVQEVLGNRSEIRRALEYQKFVPDVLCIYLGPETET